MTFKVRDFKAEDVAKIDPLPVYNGTHKIISDMADVLEQNSSVLVMTFTMDDMPVAILGLTPDHEKSGYVWSLISKDAALRPKALHKQAISVLNWMQDALGYERLSANTPANCSGWRWLERLGFEREGTMVKYGADGSDYFLYARVI